MDQRDTEENPSSAEVRTLDLAREHLVVDKRVVETGRVSVSVRTAVENAEAKASLEYRAVDVRRVPIGRVVDTAPEIRFEDGVTIVPVLEEVMVVEKRLVLVEEVHISTRTTAEEFVQSVPLRKQTVVVDRTPAGPHQADRSTAMSMHTATAGSSLVTAFFDTRTDADAAMERIVAEGIDRGSIRIVEGSGTDADRATESKGFWESLGDLFMPDDDRRTYAEGLSRGGYLLNVRTTEANHDRILDILDDEGTIDMDEREQSWRSEGWNSDETTHAGSGTASTVGIASQNSGAAYATVARTTDDVLPISGTHDVVASRSDSMATQTGSIGAGDLDKTTALGDGENADRIDVVEENLRVGKRDVSRGRVKVRSYVVEDVVNQDVNLRTEHVDIQRRTVDRPVAGVDAFADKTIELEETAEEAVVSKEARVVEEIDLATVATDRTETVSDTVRRTEVEIEDERKAEIARGTGTTGSDN